ncbi:MAG: AbrB/MazE/SpoVT family DNA-binding domain-containing protein [Bacteroidetes bacterium]|jgi:putative addiction module antidote|nr:AbrB/MazE/SpoVT family DNA-binding domain-containing protein [Bacteroidota bacterium]
MSTSLKVRKVGNSLGLILPKETLDALNGEEGHTLFVVQTPEGIRPTPHGPEWAEAAEDARVFMDTHRNAFKKLAE